MKLGVVVKIYLDVDINVVFGLDGIQLGKLSEAESKILSEFIDNRGKCLSRERLIQVGWTNTIVVENSLNMAIRKFRSLGIEIETVPRVGYALVYEHLVKAKRADLIKETGLENSDSPSADVSVGNIEVGGAVTLPDSIQRDDFITDSVRIKSVSPDINPSSSIDKKGVWKKIKRWLLVNYIILIAGLYYVLEEAKPNITCFKRSEVKVCTTYDDFNVNKIDGLEPGFYLYGNGYDEDEINKPIFIKVEN